MNSVIESSVQFKELIGFRASNLGSGWYRISAVIMNKNDKFAELPVTDTTSEEFLSTWKGVRTLAYIFTGKKFTLEIWNGGGKSPPHY